MPVSDQEHSPPPPELSELEALIANYDIELDFHQITERPDIEDWSKGSTHWSCVLSWKIYGDQELPEGVDGGEVVDFYYSMGSAYTGNPQLVDVLHCLCSDSSSAVSHESFEDWADNFGYDTDSREAEKVYNACVEQAGKVQSFLGNMFEDFCQAEH